MKYILSPEFHRQLWLRFSPFRLVAAPLVILLLIITTGNLPKDFAGIQVDNTSMLYGALTIYYLVVIVWGTYEAATSMQEEMRGNTWDFQRMSSITPAQLAWGKLFGATSYTWYFGALALAVIAYAYGNFHAPEPFFGADQAREPALPPPEDDTPYVLFCLVASGLIGQSFAFLYSFADHTFLFGRTGRTKPPKGIGAFLLGVAAGTEVYIHTVKIEALHLQPRAYAMLRSFELTWYGNNVDRDSFVIWSLLFFIGWFLIGSYRIARAELLYRNLPFVWMAFAASVVAWNCGFLFHVSTLMGGGARYLAVYLPAFIQMLFICYLCMVLESSDTQRYARLAYHARRRDMLRALENTPKWLATVPLVLLLFTMVAGASGEVSARIEPLRVIIFMASLMLFMIRDGCVIHGINLAFRGRGNAFAIMMYYVMVYGLLPAVSVTSLHFSMTDAVNSLMSMRPPANASLVASVFYPTALADPMAGMAFALAEAIAAAAWLYSRIRKSYAPSVIANQKG